MNWNGVDLLKAMYTEPIANTEHFQDIVIETMSENHLKLPNRGVKVMERSLFCVEHCFLQNSFNNKVLSHDQYDRLMQKCRRLQTDLPNLFIYTCAYRRNLHCNGSNLEAGLEKTTFQWSVYNSYTIFTRTT